MRPALPQILQEVAEIAGLDAALQLARARGGRRLYVPEEPTEHFMSEIGPAAARALSQLYGRENIVIPLGPVGPMNEARLIADDAIARGLSVSEAAKLSGLTERAIQRRNARRESGDAPAPSLVFSPAAARTAVNDRAARRRRSRSRPVDRRQGSLFGE